ncbi:MAG TPA: FAD-binding oxidoreductase [Stellaceae bacterium]|nr:FAD-binding oxidoreductase [Stellaceae bacterium]
MISRGQVAKAPAIEKPATAEELATRLREAAAGRLAVAPVGGGRARGMGNPLERCDVELHTARLDRVLEHSQADMIVSVEAGIRLEDLQAELAKAGQFLPLDAFRSPGHTIGGLLATGWTGPLRMRYGSPRDFLIGIRVALPDGKLVTAGGRVVKNVSGYDMMKLHYGALGTLGVIVAASFKVFPKPLHDVTVTSDGGWEAAERALAGPLAPVALEVLSDGTVMARFFGGPAAVNSAVAGLGWKPASEDPWPTHAARAPERLARIAVPRTKLKQCVELLPQGSAWWASAGSGIAYWEPEDARAVTDVRSRVEAAGGSLVILAAPDDFTRSAGAWGSPPATLEIMRRIKTAFDPGNVLNPGRFVY